MSRLGCGSPKSTLKNSIDRERSRDRSRERERDREIDRERERERDTHTETQRHRDSDAVRFTFFYSRIREHQAFSDSRTFSRILSDENAVRCTLLDVDNCQTASAPKIAKPFCFVDSFPVRVWALFGNSRN